MKTGFVKISAVSPKIKVADVKFNTESIIASIKKEAEKKTQFIVFPELCICGYTCADLFLQNILTESCEEALLRICAETRDTSAIISIGLPVRADGALYNCAAVIQSGTVLAVIPKTYLPNYSEYYEKRWFASGDKAVSGTVKIGGNDVPFGKALIKASDDVTLGVEICEDLWVPVSPSEEMCFNGANLIVNLSASNEAVTKNDYRLSIIKAMSAKCFCAYAYASAGFGESTTDLVFSGACSIVENGALLSEGERFSPDGSVCTAYIDIEKLNAERIKNGSFSDNAEKFRSYEYHIIETDIEQLDYSDIEREFNPLPFVPADNAEKDARCREILNIQSCGLAKRLQHTNQQKVVVGISGGLDSTLALLVSKRAMDILNLPYENIICITMPGFGTTDLTYTNAVSLIKSIGGTFIEIDIKPACILHMQDIAHDISIHDITYENTQARERTQILMDMANEHGALLVGTGDLSELALGWCTYNADHMSMYGVNAGVPKTLVRDLVRNEASRLDERTKSILESVLATPVSPELLPPDKDGKIEQKTEEQLGPYEVHDFYLYHFLRFGTKPQKLLFMAQRAFKDKYSEEQLTKWLKLFIKRFFSSQFKRSCLPDGPKVGSVSLSPRGDWRMPSDAESNLWLEF